jgi:hypothetical protein
VEETIGTCGPTGWRLDPDLLAGLLDYYNSRAVSFASLLVASIFGLVTLSAIIQITFGNATLEISLLIPLIMSLLLYLLFSVAGLYMLKSYSYYTALADKVKVQGLETPYFKDLKNITFPDDKGLSTSLIDTFYSEQKKHSLSFPKRYIQKYVNTWKFKLLFGVALTFLAVIIYWHIIEQSFALLDISMNAISLSAIAIVIAIAVVALVSFVYFKSRKEKLINKQVFSK